MLVLQVFNEKHASSHLGIPLGAIITQALPDIQPEKALHEPVCCSSCDAYLNMYSEVGLLPLQNSHDAGALQPASTRAHL